ncbi:hypothetical protein LWI29_003009 [Acer saccharum]|uniref:Retrovirus-related Pol polyprotein from transposon TNT 1-94-like beta-barrel domain-containing protein n=1 Tax=Acer saccharum TaxID=4024 RepID=A0AA39SZ11_ACESA|nr:hypothetical protein LWI29_003009 [Acer saccharum]
MTNHMHLMRSQPLFGRNSSRSNLSRMFDLPNDCNFELYKVNLQKFTPAKRIVVAQDKIIGFSNNEGEGTALFTNNKKFFKGNQNVDGDNQKEGSKSSSYKNRVKCYHCGKLGHINCVKLNEGNLAEKDEPSHDSEDWGNYFLAKNTTVDAIASINFENDWIIDFGCGHHLTRDKSNFSSFKKYMGNHAIVTADNPVYHIEKGGSVVVSDGGDSEITICSMYHVAKVKKNLFSIANVVDFRSYLLFRLKGVKFLRNLKKVDADVVHSGK